MSKKMPKWAEHYQKWDTTIVWTPASTVEVFFMGVVLPWMIIIGTLAGGVLALLRDGNAVFSILIAFVFWAVGVCSFLQSTDTCLYSHNIWKHIQKLFGGDWWKKKTSWNESFDLEYAIQCAASQGSITRSEIQSILLQQLDDDATILNIIQNINKRQLVVGTQMEEEYHGL